MLAKNDFGSSARERKISNVLIKRGAKGADIEKLKALRRGEWGRGIPLPIRLGGLVGEHCELPSGVRGRAPAQNEFCTF